MDGGRNLTCFAGAPFSHTVHFYERVFVVAEVDDTYVYHIHVGKYNSIPLRYTVLLNLSFVIMSRDHASNRLSLRFPSRES